MNKGRIWSENIITNIIKNERIGEIKNEIDAEKKKFEVKIKLNYQTLEWSSLKQRDIVKFHICSNVSLKWLKGQNIYSIQNEIKYKIK